MESNQPDREQLATTADKVKQLDVELERLGLTAIGVRDAAIDILRVVIDVQDTIGLLLQQLTRIARSK